MAEKPSYEALEMRIKELESGSSDLQESKEALIETCGRYQSLLETLPLAIFEMDLEGNLLYINDSGLKLFGYTSKELSEGLNAYQIIHEDDLPKMTERLPRVLAGETLVNSEYIAKKKDGTYFPILVTSSPLYKGVLPIGFRGTIIDVTDKKDAELQQMEKKRLEWVLEIAGAVCHELNQPLMVVSMNSEMLMGEIDSGHPGYEKVSKIFKGVHEMGAITQKLMNIGRYRTKSYGGRGRIIDIDASGGKDE